MDKITEKCLAYNETSGCVLTFDGQCNKENCQTYNLLKENEELKEEIKTLNQELDVGYIKYPAERNQITTLYGLPIQTWKNIKEENEKLKSMINKSVFLPNIEEKATNKYKQALMEIRKISEKFDGNHLPSVINMVSVIRQVTNEVIGAEE